MRVIKLLLLFNASLLLVACNSASDTKSADNKVVEARAVLIQPLGGFPEKQAKILKKRIEQIVPHVAIADPIPLASSAYFEP